MAYINQYQGYSPYYYQNAPQAQNPPNTASNSIIWVQGEAGAKSYLVAPNSTVQLWDSEAQVIYLKSADATGMPSIKTLDYTIREMPSQAQASAMEYATVEDLNALKKQIEALRKELKSKAKEVKSDE